MLTGTTKLHTQMAFDYWPGDTKVRLVCGWTDSEEMSYWAVEEKKGSSPFDANYTNNAQVFGPNQYAQAREAFNNIVMKMLGA